MIGKTLYLTLLFLFSSFLLGPSWGQLVTKVDLVQPIPVPVQGTVEVVGNVGIINTPEVVVSDMPLVSMTGDVSVVNVPEVILADTARVEVVNEASGAIPVRIMNPPGTLGQEDPRNLFSWHRHAVVNSKSKSRTHSAISVSRMGGSSFVLTDIVATARFATPATHLILTFKGAGTDRGLGLDFVLVPENSHLVSNFQTGVVFGPDVALTVSVSAASEEKNFEVEYTITFSGYFLT